MDITCSACGQTNAAGRINCRSCGLRLRQLAAVVSDNGAAATTTQQTTERLAQDAAIGVAEITGHPGVAAAMAELASLQDAHTQLQAQQQTLLQALADAKQLGTVLAEGKVEAEEKLKAATAEKENLAAQLSIAAPKAGERTYNELHTLVQTMEREAASALSHRSSLEGRVRELEARIAAGLGVKSGAPLWLLLASAVGALVLGAAAGAWAGVHSGLNPYRSSAQALGQSESNNRALTQQLDTLHTQLAAGQKQLADAQVQLAQLSTQNQTLAASQQQGSAQAAALDARLGAANAATRRTQDALLDAQRQLAQQKTELEQARASASQRAAEAESLNAALAKHPSWNYKGPQQGIINFAFQIKNDKPATITLDHSRPSGDNITITSVSGASLPGVPLVVEPIGKHASIETPPTPANGWQRLTLVVQGKDQHQASVRWTVF